MKHKYYFLITICILTLQSFAQKYCDCDTVKYKKEFTGYCNEYLDNRLKSTKKEKAHFIMFVYYEKGDNLRIYPSYYDSRGSKKNTYNGKEICKTDSILILNGLVESYNRQGTKTSSTLFRDGKIIKLVNYNWGIFRSLKKIGKQVHEINEYYYLDNKIEAQIVSYQFSGILKFNVYASKSTDGKWNFNDVTNLLTTDPMKLNK